MWSAGFWLRVFDKTTPCFQRNGNCEGRVKSFYTIKTKILGGKRITVFQDQLEPFNLIKKRTLSLYKV